MPPLAPSASDLVMPTAAPAAAPEAQPAEPVAVPEADQQAQIDAAAEAVKSATPTTRPEVPQDLRANVTRWFERTDNLKQRETAKHFYNEAHKAMFPAAFNPNNPARGMQQAEAVTGEDTRRVEIPRLFRDGLQSAAMSVPDDLTFKFVPSPVVEPPPELSEMAAQMGLLPTAPGAASVIGNDPMVAHYGRSMTCIENALVAEANFIPKMQAWVQDSGYFPASIIKFNFRRDYTTMPASANTADRDSTDGMARMQALISMYAAKQFSADSAEMRELKNLMSSLAGKARTKRYYGIEINLVPMDSFGMSEDGMDLVDIYDAAFMFEDCVMTGNDLLAHFPYTVGQNGETFGILPDELGSCTPYTATDGATFRNGSDRLTSGRMRNTPTVRQPSNLSMKDGTDPRASKYFVRTIYSKQDRTIYTLVRGLNHYIKVEIPTKTCARWYQFGIIAPNRIPTEVYQAADLRLKMDIMRRINRKRSDEEKARWLAIERYIYNTAGDMDAKEVVKIGDIPPGHFKGINFGSPTAKPSDNIFPVAHKFDPAAYDTSKDERDLDMMGAMPAQALGATNGAGFATEANIAAQGSSIMSHHRQKCVQREIDGFLTAIGEVIAQELTAEEARAIGGAYTFFPEVYGDGEVEQILQQAKEAAAGQVYQQVLDSAIMQAQTTGVPPDERAIQAQLDALVAPIVQAQMLETYGMPEPVSRESLHRRMRIQIKSSFNANLEKQNNILMFQQLAGALLQMSQTAQLAGVPFDIRPILREMATLVGGSSVIDEAFPNVPAAQLEQMIQQAMAKMMPPAAPGAEGSTQDGAGASGGIPSAQGPQGEAAKATSPPGTHGAAGGLAGAEAGTQSLV